MRGAPHLSTTLEAPSRFFFFFFDRNILRRMDTIIYTDHHNE